MDRNREGRTAGGRSSLAPTPLQPSRDSGAQNGRRVASLRHRAGTSRMCSQHALRWAGWRLRHGGGEGMDGRPASLSRLPEASLPVKYASRMEESSVLSEPGPGPVRICLLFSTSTECICGAGADGEANCIGTGPSCSVVPSIGGCLVGVARVSRWRGSLYVATGPMKHRWDTRQREGKTRIS